jgi:pantoate--beta-alanine ligase
VKVARTRNELREALVSARREGRTVGLVPTMGYLHEGHLSLLEAARRRCDVTVMSLFVNPAQFGPSEDLASYPRDETRDLEFASGAGVDLVYAPSAEEVYPEGFATTVEVGRRDAAPATSAGLRPWSRSSSTPSSPMWRSSGRRTPSRRS